MSSFKAEFAKALVAGWHGEWPMWMVVKTACRNAGVEADNYLEIDSLVAKEIPAKIWPKDRAQRWVAVNMRPLNEALWAGRPRELCENMAYLRLSGKGPKPNPGARYMVAVRHRDKRSDWATVK